MGLKFINKSECPPGQFRYKSPETGTWFEAVDFPTLVARVKSHYRANNLPIGLLFEDQIEDQACQNTDPQACKQEGYGSTTPYAPSTFEQVITATKIMLSWLIGGFVREPMPEIMRRSKICIGCNFNDKAQGCPSCGTDKMRELIAGIVSDSPSPLDPSLMACRLCGCGLQAKVRIPIAILKKHEPEILKGQYPPWCWMNV